MRRPLLAAIMTVAVAQTPAHAFETRAGAAWVLDETSNTVLLEKNAHEALPPASMSKLMTLEMLFEALRDGRVTMDTPFTVSTRAKSMEGSTMFLNELDHPTVWELIHGIIVNSGNDACVVVAEGLAGTEDEFAARMTERARALGMNDTVLANASGWPDPRHRMSMHDLGILAQHIIEEFPEDYKFFAETEFDYKDRAPGNRFNRNPLLKMGINADGLKTGHTAEAGFGLVGSAVQDGRRIIFVVTGLASDKDRAEEAERIATWAFRDFALKIVAKQGDRLADAEVWLGDRRTVGLVLGTDARLIVPAQGQSGVTAEVVYDGPIHAPLTAGQEVASLVVDVPGIGKRTLPLLAEADVPKGGFLARMGTAASQLMRQAVGAGAGS